MSFRGREYTRSSLFKELESKELKPLPVNRYELKEYANATVHKNSHIYFNKDKHYYSVPYTFIGKKVRIVYSTSLIEIYYKQEFITSHPRNKRKYTYTTNKDHMASQHNFVSEWSSEYFISWAHAIGNECKVYIEKILDKRQHPEQSYKSCMGILQLSKKVGKYRLNNACRRALEYGAYNYNTIVNILEKGWDAIENDNTKNELEVPSHQNIRGKTITNNYKL